MSLPRSRRSNSSSCRSRLAFVLLFFCADALPIDLPLVFAHRPTADGPQPVASPREDDGEQPTGRRSTERQPAGLCVRRLGDATGEHEAWRKISSASFGVTRCLLSFGRLPSSHSKSLVSAVKLASHVPISSSAMRFTDQV